jgi:hypothetical protein
MEYKPLDDTTKQLADTSSIQDMTCVICLDLLDSSGIVASQQSKMTRTPECRCEYHAHRSCFEQWVSDKPTNDLNCLVCGSGAVLLISHKERCEACMEKCVPPKNIVFLSSVATTFFVYLIMNGPW